MTIDQNSDEIRAALIGAASRVYAAGLQAANSTSESIRRSIAERDVEHFFETLQKHS